MKAYSQLILKAVEQYDESVRYHKTNLKYLGMAVEMSLAYLEMDDVLDRVAAQANDLWLQYLRADDPYIKQRAEEELTNLLFYFRPLIYRATLEDNATESEDGEGFFDVGSAPMAGAFLIRRK